MKAPGIAVGYLSKALQGNYSPAYYDLAVFYEEEVGVKKNYKKAFEYYLNAALFGDKQSLYEVGRCYYYGKGVAKDMDTASIWIEHAEKSGITDE